MSYVPDRSIPVIVQIRNILEYLCGLEIATGRIDFSGIPSNNENVIISDGVTAITYTFKTTPTAANHVQIAATSDATMDNLYDAILLNAPATADESGTIPDPARGIVPELVVNSGSTDNDHILLYNTKFGTDGNVTITTTSAVVSVTGMSGGADANAVLGV